MNILLQADPTGIMGIIGTVGGPLSAVFAAVVVYLYVSNRSDMKARDKQIMHIVKEQAEQLGQANVVMTETNRLLIKLAD